MLKCESYSFAEISPVGMGCVFKIQPENIQQIEYIVLSIFTKETGKWNILYQENIDSEYFKSIYKQISKSKQYKLMFLTSIIKNYAEFIAEAFYD